MRNVLLIAQNHSRRFLCCVAAAFRTAVLSANSLPFIADDSLQEAVMRKAAIAVAVCRELSAAPAMAAAATPVRGWTGFYLGLAFGAGWNAQAVNYSPTDFVSTLLLNGKLFGNSQRTPNGYRIAQSGPVGGFEAGYNWQAGSNWLLGLETDFSLSDLSGQASGTSIFEPGITQSTAAKQSTDWYGTVRARAGFLATPNLLLFGTGGLAYGRWRIPRAS